MDRKPLDDLGDLQRAAIETVWELGQATVHQVRQSLARRKKLAYTTVLTALQKLEKAGWLSHRSEGKSYVYFATATRREAGAGSLKRYIKRVFDGDATLMFQHLISETKLSDDDLARLREMIDQKRKETKR
jgi:BlaI family penicillinase repressor